MIDLTFKVAVVTGASSGIGAALARELSVAGARVALFARRAERLEETTAGCPGPSLIMAGDVTRADDCAVLLQAVEKRWGGVDLLINNAGLGVFGEFGGFDDDDWRNLFEVNLFSVVRLIRQALPLMEGRNGFIVNMASIGGLVAHSDRVTPYVASKHAVVGLSRGLARDLADSGVRVKAVCPHLTDTEFFNAPAGEDGPAAEMAAEADKYRSFMDTPQDVARGVLAGLDRDGVILFPTDKPAKAYDKMREI